MALPFAQNPSALPLDTLFPAEYAATKRMIIRDFATFGTAIVVLVIGVAAYANV